MEQIDWDSAPEGATHFLPEQPARGWVACWYKIVDGTWFARNAHDCDWYPDHDYQEIFIPLLVGKPAPWSGTGLPPVGIEFEWRYGDHAWKTGSALYIGSVYAILKSRDEEQHYYVREMQFRPLRTPEQIAAELREKAIAEMVYGGCGVDQSDGSTTAFVICGLLYDAGYRKFEIVPE